MSSTLLYSVLGIWRISTSVLSSGYINSERVTLVVVVSSCGPLDSHPPNTRPPTAVSLRQVLVFLLKPDVFSSPEGHFDVTYDSLSCYNNEITYNQRRYRYFLTDSANFWEKAHPKRQSFSLRAHHKVSKPLGHNPFSWIHSLLGLVEGTTLHSVSRTWLGMK